MVFYKYTVSLHINKQCIYLILIPSNYTRTVLLTNVSIHITVINCNLIFNVGLYIHLQLILFSLNQNLIIALIHFYCLIHHVYINLVNSSAYLWKLRISDVAESDLFVHPNAEHACGIFIYSSKCIKLALNAKKTLKQQYSRGWQAGR